MPTIIFAKTNYVKRKEYFLFHITSLFYEKEKFKGEKQITPISFIYYYY